jgi:hypothetical protein
MKQRKVLQFYLQSEGEVMKEDVVPAATHEIPDKFVALSTELMALSARATVICRNRPLPIDLDIFWISHLLYESIADLSADVDCSIPTRNRVTSGS